MYVPLPSILVFNDITGNDCARKCPMCQKMPGHKIIFKIIEGTLDFGLSTLHFGPRSMEWCLNVAYSQGLFQNFIRM